MSISKSDRHHINFMRLLSQLFRMRIVTSERVDLAGDSLGWVQGSRRRGVAPLRAVRCWSQPRIHRLNGYLVTC